MDFFFTNSKVEASSIFTRAHSPYNQETFLLKKWDPIFSSINPYVIVGPRWIRLLKVPFHAWNHTAFVELGAIYGGLLKINLVIKNQTQL